MKINLTEIRKGIEKAALKTKETSEAVVEAAKLKYKISEINSDINEQYIKIGKLVFNASDDDDITESIKIPCEELSALISQRDAMQDRLNELANKKICSACGLRFDRDFDFCPRCGKKYQD